MSSEINESGYNLTDVVDSNSSKSSCHSLFSGLASLNDEQSYSVLLEIMSNIINFYQLAKNSLINFDRSRFISS